MEEFCESCGTYEVKLKTWERHDQIGEIKKVKLCEVCSNVDSRILDNYEHTNLHYLVANLIKMIIQCTNLILKEIKKVK